MTAAGCAFGSRGPTITRVIFGPGLVFLIRRGGRAITMWGLLVSTAHTWHWYAGESSPVDDALPTPSQREHRDYPDDRSSYGTEHGSVLAAYCSASDLADGEKDNGEQTAQCEHMR